MKKERRSFSAPHLPNTDPHTLGQCVGWGVVVVLEEEEEEEIRFTNPVGQANITDGRQHFLFKSK